MAELILELALIIGVAAILALVARMIKQPVIIAYLIAGILVGPLVFNLLQSEELIQSFAHIGVALLLFVVGLSLDFRIFKHVGKVVMMAGIAEILIVSMIGFWISLLLGFGYISSLFIATALTFSSTVVVVKLLSDKNEIETLHGRIAIGILILQDFAAAILLMMIPVLSGSGVFGDIAYRFGEAILLIGGVFVFAYIIFPGVLAIAARNQEVLFLFSIAWALIISVLFDFLGFSLEIGALLAGMALASSKYNLEIQGKVKGIRDFFVILFFVFFGSQLIGPLNQTLVFNALILSAFVLIGKPLVIMSFMRIIGYKKRTNFYTGISLAQVSEFSLILVLIGFNVELIGREILSLIILVALFTIALSSYMTYYSQPIFNLLSVPLNIFNGRRKGIESLKKNKSYDIILIGYNRIGFSLLKMFTKEKKKFLVVDYNPKTIVDLSARGVSCVYGDANDLELLKSLRLGKVKTVISTIPDLKINRKILATIDNPKIVFIPTSHSIYDTMELYRCGATYVIMPHFLGGDYISHLLKKDDFKKKKLFGEGKKQIKDLNERLIEGQDHPSKEDFGK